MIKLLWKSLLISPALLGAALVMSSNATAAQVQSSESSAASNTQASTLLAQAAPGQVVPLPAQAAPANAPLSPLNQIEVYKSGYTTGMPVIVINSASQVTSVSQLSDVQPTDWAFQALQSLVERYGVIAGYPDGTYRGNRAMTRYEFAAGLNAALDRVNELIAAGTADLVTKEDLATLQRLQEEFAAELATLRGRVDSLEVRTSELEAQQFSTTTKLSGEVVFNIAGVAGGQSNGTGVSGPVGGTSNQLPNDISTSTAFGERIRLNFDTSFSGRDRLRVRFEQVGLGRFQTLSGSTFNEGRLAFDANSNAFNIGLLQYRFPAAPGVTAYLAAAGNGYDNLDFTAQLNPFFDDTGSGALSRFGQRPAIFRYASGAGGGVRWRFNDGLEVNLGYLAGGGANSPADPFTGRGLFNGQYSALGQVVINPAGAFRVGLTYANSYAPGALSAPGAVGSLTGMGSNAVNVVTPNGVQSDSYNIALSWRLNPAFTLGGWVGYSNHRYIALGDADVWTWAATLAFPDLGGEGNLAGIIVGQEPRIASTSSLGLANAIGLPTKNGQVQRANPDAGLHIEGFYRFQLTDNISLTPGLIWLTSPNQDERNNDVVIGVLRTVFKF